MPKSSLTEDVRPFLGGLVDIAGLSLHPSAAVPFATVPLCLCPFLFHCLSWVPRTKPCSCSSFFPVPLSAFFLFSWPLPGHRLIASNFLYGSVVDPSAIPDAALTNWNLKGNCFGFFAKLPDEAVSYRENPMDCINICTDPSVPSRETGLCCEFSSCFFFNPHVDFRVCSSQDSGETMTMSSE